MMKYILIIICTLCALETSFGQDVLTKVVIDAGHGDKDSGARGRRSMEKDIVLDVALRVGKLINDSLPSVEVIYTRDDDTFIPLDERAAIANKNKAQLFISIHANSSNNSQVSGTETFVLGLHRTKDNLEVAQKENSVITLEDNYTEKYEGFDPNQAESYIIFELMQNLYLEQSINMASKVHEKLVGLGLTDRTVKQAGFLVLRETAMPGVLVELGFISNEEEEKYMLSEEGKKALSEAIFAGFRAHKEVYDASALSADKVSGEQPLVYRVQIAKLRKPMKNLKTEFGMIEVRREGNLYVHSIGNYRDYEEAVGMRDKIKEEYEGCFLTAFRNGEKVEMPKR